MPRSHPANHGSYQFNPLMMSPCSATVSLFHLTLTRSVVVTLPQLDTAVELKHIGTDSADTVLGKVVWSAR
ncbi:hypothetical protein Trydic_g13045 [Trypoxylus dichotomus]